MQVFLKLDGVAPVGNRPSRAKQPGFKLLTLQFEYDALTTIPKGAGIEFSSEHVLSRGLCSVYQCSECFIMDVDFHMLKGSKKRLTWGWATSECFRFGIVFYDLLAHIDVMYSSVA